MLKNLLFKLSAIALMVGMTNMAFAQGMSCDMAEVVTPGTFTLAEDIPENGSNTQPTNTSNNDSPVTGAVWYSFTPAESGLMDVDACLGGSDTRLFVWTGACDGLTSVAFNDDACPIVEDGSAWASAVQGVPVTGGTTYYIEWDNGWEATAFTWNLAFQPLPEVDIAAAGNHPYTRIPDTQAAAGIPLDGVLGNLGSGPLTGATLTVTVTDVATGAELYTETSTPQDLAVGDVVAVDFTDYVPAAQTELEITYTSAANETEEESEQANNGTTSGVVVVKKTYAYDRVITGGLGVGGGEIIQGQTHFFYANDTITSVTLSYNGGNPGDTITVEIFSVDDTGTPSMMLASTDAPLGQGWVTVTLDEEFPVMAGETYFVGLRSITAGEENIGLSTDNTNFYPGQAFIQGPNLGGGAWLNPEGFGFNVSYAVRVNTKGDAMYNLTLAVDMSNEMVSENGVHVAGNFQGWDPAATPMSDDDGDGVYTVTVSVPQLMVAEYKFINGNEWGMDESVPEACGVDNGQGGFNRFADVQTFDVEQDVVCFSLCETCPIEQEPCTNPDAVICDNFDQYDLGNIDVQSDIWEPWPNTIGGDVTDAQAQSGTQSLVIDGATGTIDQILLLPDNVTSGNYTVRWSFFIPEGKGAYFNLQGDQNTIGANSIFKMQIDFQPDGIYALDAGGADVAGGEYAQGEWIDIVHYLDFDNDWAQLLIDGELVHQWLISDDTFAGGGTAQVGAVNFFPLSTDYEFYIDDLEVVAVPSCADNSIICDPMESYMLGAPSSQSPWWATWAGTTDPADDGEVSNLRSSGGGEKSLLLTGGAVQDPILLLGNRSEGRYRVAFDMYMEDGNTGYYNIQEDETPGVEWNIDLYFDGPDAGRVEVGFGNEVATFSYSNDEWVNVENIVDLDNSTIAVNINGAEVYAGEYIGTQLGSVNFYPADANAVYHVDNINYSELEPIVVEPNPVMVTFTADASFAEVAEDGIFLAGTFNGFTGEAMTDNGDGTWSLTKEVPANSEVLFKYQNGFEGWESVPEACGMDDGFGGFNRFLNVEEADVTLDAVCLNACVACDLTNTIDLGFDAAIAVAPNPTNGMFNVSYTLGTPADLSFRVSNILGQVIVDRQVDAATAGTEAFDLTDMPAGTYNLVITDGARMSTKRIIVE